jgi:chromatin remodeling complex protein RSC6
MSSTSAPAKTAAKRVAKKSDAAPAAAAVAVAAPVVAASTTVVAPAKATKAKKETSTAPVAAAPVASEVTAPATEAAPQRSVTEQIADAVAELTKMRDGASKLISTLKKLDKQQAREVKDARKRRKNKKVEVTVDGEVKPKKPNVFEKPHPISDSLCGFFGRPNGSQMSRAEVTSEIAAYIKKNGLQLKHEITPDAKLTALLGPMNTGDKLTYFNIQKYLNVHYLTVKPVVAPVATA